MRTEDLIGALVVDGEAVTPPLARRFLLAIAAGAVLTALVFTVLVGPRHDIAAAAATPRFLLKFVEAAGLAAAAGLTALRLLRPAADRRAGRLALALVVLLVVAAVIGEALLVPADQWGRRLVGTNWYHCLALVPFLGLPPFALALWAARDGAATDPGRTGAAVGLVAGGIGAFFYAANCIDDSPFFVATWYTLAVLALAGLGALIGRRILAW